MTTIRSTLQSISTGYALFEKDQVLTSDQLNSIASYLECQQHLDRVLLLGVGILSGLQVALQMDGSVALGRGFGVATDGDLLAMVENSTYDRYKVYDESQPVYAPFYPPPAGGGQGALLPLYELVPTGSQDPRALSLNAFQEKSGKALGDMAALLYLECYATDRDFCAITDCDNLGQENRTTLKLLLVEKQQAGLLHEAFDTPHQAYYRLAAIDIERPLITSGVSTLNQLAGLYRTACDKILGKLLPELRDLMKHCGSFLGNLFVQDPAAEWDTFLKKYRNQEGANDKNVQYFYDFLKDVAETCNAFRELLFGDNTLASPALAAFPKHLLLGNLVADEDSPQNRTLFYPSPLTSRTAGQLEHARFLLRKIDALIRTFQPPASGTIRITPSLGEEQPLEERAIPCYYPASATTPIHSQWNYRLHQRRQESSQFSYNAEGYQGPTEPLTRQIGRFPFFRIEGHIGKAAHDAVDEIRRQIGAYNLPFGLHSIMLGRDLEKVLRKPGIRYTDLHRLHYLVRQDVSQQLHEVTTFSQNFKQKIGAAVKSKVVNDSEAQGVELNNISKDHNAAIARGAAQARTTLNRSYSSYKSDSANLQKSLVPVLQSAGQFKSRLGDVVKTDFVTPIDSLIGNPHIKWLDWLDEIIKAKEEKEDDKLLFSTFVTLHPGLEHVAGVVRGGTFILLYDETQTVVGDFMVPYYCDDPGEEEPPEPPLKRPGLRPGWLVGNGITVLPSRDKFVSGKLTEFKEKNLAKMVDSDQLDMEVQKRFAGFRFEQVDKIQSTIQNQFNQQQKEYFTAMKDSVTMMGSVLSGRKELASNLAGAAVTGDVDLDKGIENTRGLSQTVVYFEEQIAKNPDKKEQLMPLVDKAREALADVVAETTRHVAAQAAAGKMDASPGSGAFEAVMELNKGVELIKGSTAEERLTKAVADVSVEKMPSTVTFLVGNIRTRKMT